MKASRAALPCVQKHMKRINFTNPYPEKLMVGHEL